MTRTRRNLAVLIFTAAVSLTAACSSSSDGGTSPTPVAFPSSDTAAPSDPPAPTDGDTTAAAAPVDSNPPVASGVFQLQSTTGITVNATIGLHAPFPTATAANTWTSEGGSGSLPCVTDAQTDAVMVGTLQFTNVTPSFTPDFYINFNGITTGGSLALGIGYGNGNQCVTDGPDAYEGSAIEPNWKSSSWGPVPIDLVIHGDIGPNFPNGNPANLGPITLVANSQSSDQYGLESEGGIINQLNGPVMQLHLEQVHE